MSENQKICQHIQSISSIKYSKAYECEACVKIGAKWMHLRTCQTCGITLCCDSSPNQHMSKHAAIKNHPVASSAEPGENWMWCYIDHIGVDFES